MRFCLKQFSKQLHSRLSFSFTTNLLKVLRLTFSGRFKRRRFTKHKGSILAITMISTAIKSHNVTLSVRYKVVVIQQAFQVELSIVPFLKVKVDARSRYQNNSLNL